MLCLGVQGWATLSESEVVVIFRSPGDRVGIDCCHLVGCDVPNPYLGLDGD